MSADEIRPEDAWPLPPAWMWSCQKCAELYRTMKRVQEQTEELRLTGERGIDYDPMDRNVTSQMSLAEHMAAAHLELLPAWDPDCATCKSHRAAIAREAGESDRAAVIARFGNEHRARHAFAPPRAVGLM
ncbi:hypothetical protein ACIHCQ_38510 [Streptomyces sp. NPDC052236]|uniref:hypothetical protein n=1 Tax=Streptomyces sp. NPDC052236 TaxID=3365686 RepID=UPI0037D702FD